MILVETSVLTRRVVEILTDIEIEFP